MLCFKCTLKVTGALRDDVRVEQHLFTNQAALKTPDHELPRFTETCIRSSRPVDEYHSLVSFWTLAEINDVNVIENAALFP